MRLYHSYVVNNQREIMVMINIFIITFFTNNYKYKFFDIFISCNYNDINKNNTLAI